MSGHQPSPCEPAEDEHFHWEKKHTVPENEHVPRLRKLAYGFGGLSDFFYLNVVSALAVPIYTVALKMDPMLIGIALALPKIIGAITDPVVGGISDNTRSKWGRRRGFILMGAILGGILLPFAWMPPVPSQTGMFVYLCVFLGVFAIGNSVFSVPYGALGLELSTHYDERTRVLAWRAYIQTIGTLAAAWFYWFCLRPVFGNEVIGARWLSVLAGIVIIGGAVATVLGCRERTQQVVSQPKMPLMPALKQTLRNRPFLLLLSTTLIITLGTGCEGLIGTYVHIYYTCQGDKNTASLISGFGGSLTVFAALASVPLGIFLSTRFGKREAAICGLLIALVSISILPFTLVPENPYRIIVSWVIMAFGMPCASLMFGSMMADVCDEDEVSTGLRREGSYVSVGAFFGKIATVVTLLLGGWLPHLAGFTDPSRIPTLPQLQTMRAMLIGIQLFALIAAIAVLWYYPISRKRSAETRRLLDERKTIKAKSPKSYQPTLGA